MSQEKIPLQQLIKYLHDMGYHKEAHLIEKIRVQVPFGEITIVTRHARIERVKEYVKYDDLLSDGL